MPAGTIVGHSTAVSIAAIDVLSTLTTHMTDAAGTVTQADGQPYTVTFTNVYPSERATWPSVQVEVAFGRRVNGYGLQRLSTDADGNPIYGYTAKDSTITLYIHALSDAERRYLVDFLASGIEAACYIDPTTHTLYDGVIKIWLGERGITYKGLGAIRYPPPKNDDPHPEGQRFDAELPLLCDLFVSWVGGTQPLSHDIFASIYNTTQANPTALASSITLDLHA